MLGDPEKQGNLIRQLQEQHYIQYMQQLQAAQRDPETNKNDNCDKETISEGVSMLNCFYLFSKYLSLIIIFSQNLLIIRMIRITKQKKNRMNQAWWLPVCGLDRI